jgi:hypothetical protein
MSSTDASIEAQTAAKAAADLFSGTGDEAGMKTAMTAIFKGIQYLKGSVAQTQQGALAQAEANLAQGGIAAQSAGFRNLEGVEDRWKDALLENPSDWYNNIGDSRATSGGGSGPDFKFKDDDAKVGSLYLNGKYGPAPKWVFDKLGLQFPGQAAPQAAAAPDPAPNAVNSYGPDEAPF